MKFTIAFLIFSLLLILTVAGNAQTYTVKTFDYAVAPTSMNNHGHAAGSVLPPGSEFGTAFFWTPRHGMKSAALTGDTSALHHYSSAAATNDHRHVGRLA